MEANDWILVLSVLGNISVGGLGVYLAWSAHRRQHEQKLVEKQYQLAEEVFPHVWRAFQHLYQKGLQGPIVDEQAYLSFVEDLDRVQDLFPRAWAIWPERLLFRLESLYFKLIEIQALAGSQALGRDQLDEVGLLVDDLFSEWRRTVNTEELTEGIRRVTASGRTKRKLESHDT